MQREPRAVDPRVPVGHRRAVRPGQPGPDDLARAGAAGARDGVDSGVARARDGVDTGAAADAVADGGASGRRGRAFDAGGGGGAADARVGGGDEPDARLQNIQTQCCRACSTRRFPFPLTFENPFPLATIYILKVIVEKRK